MKGREKSIIAKRLVHSFLSSVISISLVLLLIASAVFLIANARMLADYFKENAVISVIMHQNVDEQEALSLRSELIDKAYVKQATYVSREEGTAQMKDMLGEDFLKVFEVNPIPISIDLNVKSGYFQTDSLAAIKAELENLRQVREVTYQESLIEALNRNLEKVAVVMFAVILLLLFISFALISNTVRLSLYAKRFTIHTMMLLGAGVGFIKKPFVKQALWQGLSSAVIASAIFTLLLMYAGKGFGDAYNLFDIRILLVIYGVVFAVGILLCIFAASNVVGRIAYSSKDELYY